MRMGNKGPHGRPWIWLMAVIVICLAPLMDLRRKFTALDLDLLMAVIAVCLAPAVHPIAADIILTALAVWAMRNSR
jgi:hypothetical protein